jgi:multiple sugar transport system permease protein
MSIVTTAEPTTAREVSAPGKGRSRRPWRPRTLLLSLGAYMVAVLFLIPYLEMVITALRPASQLKNPGYLPTRIDWSNFATLWSTGLDTHLMISLEVAAGATGAVLIVALPAAYYTARHRFRGRTAFLLLVLVTQMLQPTAMLVGIFKEFSALVLTDSGWGLILVNAGFNLAFATWILSAYVASIPAELEEAAMVDGSSRLGALMRITLPLAWPGVATALIFTFIAAWNELVVALILTTQPSKQPLTVALDSFIGGYQVDWGHLFAASAVATIPVIVLFALIERKVVSGLTSGSIK